MHHPLSAPEFIAYDATGISMMQPGWRRFQHCVESVRVYAVDQVMPALQRADAWACQGDYVAGFITYEAAPAFDPALRTHLRGSLPLAWLGCFRTVTSLELPLPEPTAHAGLDWSPSINEEQYLDAVAQVRRWIEQGDTYQVNFTWRLRTPYCGHPWQLFLAMVHAQHPCYGAYCDIGDQVICSASPELFFTRHADLLTCRPMKGTAPRGLTIDDDRLQAQRLRDSEKERAENLMIVDMMRNDLGRIAAPGLVKAPSLFDAERYDTLWQMTSTVRARSAAPLDRLFAALFPCASITGAPKIRTSEIIAQLETTPRGIYTGCVGFIAPGGDAQFNVAIRTAHLNRTTGQLEYGIGSGITWDSRGASEFAECLLKARVVSEPYPSFDLLETLLWTPSGGYFLQEAHLRRLADCAEYFGFPVDLLSVRDAWQQAAAVLPSQRHRVRCLAPRCG